MQLRYGQLGVYARVWVPHMQARHGKGEATATQPNPTPFSSTAARLRVVEYDTCGLKMHTNLSLTGAWVGRRGGDGIVP